MTDDHNDPERNRGMELLRGPDPRDAEIGRLREALQDLIRAYVNLMEASRDRIIDLGGHCDPVDVMERSDFALRAARTALTAQEPER